MPIVPIDISKGLYENVNAFELGNTGHAAVLKNFLVNEAGTNVSRPGLCDFAYTHAYPVEGLHYCASANRLIVVTNDLRRFYSITSAGVATSVTADVLAGTGRPVFAEDGSYLAVAGGGALQRWSGSGNFGAFPSAGDDNPPEESTHIVYLDGYWLNHEITGDMQQIYFAGPTSTLRTQWDASSDMVSAEGLPDGVSALAVLFRELYAFGVNSTEIFQNFGDSVSPFSRTFFIDKGIIAAHSVVQADNTLWWLDSDRRFVRMEGRTPIMISEAIDSTIRGLSTVSDCWGAKIDIGGFYLIVWSFPTEQRTFAYDYKSKTWSEWQTFADSDWSLFRMNAYAYSRTWDKHLIGDTVTGNVFELSFDNHSDGDDLRKCLRRTGIINHQTFTRKRNIYYEFDIKRGVGTSGQTEPTLELRVKDDDKSWSDPIEFELGYTGEFLHSVRVHVGGIYRQRQIEFSISDEVECRISALRENFEVMVS